MEVGGCWSNNNRITTSTYSLPDSRNPEIQGPKSYKYIKILLFKAICKSKHFLLLSFPLFIIFHKNACRALKICCKTKNLKMGFEFFLQFAVY